jgi:four helix bundle protein
MNRPPDIRRRTRSYAVRSIRLFQTIGRTGGAGAIIARQFLRSATSIGANIAEAQSSESRLDFIHKFSIAQKEARESLYWLTLIIEAEIVPSRKLQPLIDETTELIAIISTIIIKSKRTPPPKKPASKS